MKSFYSVLFFIIFSLVAESQVTYRKSVSITTPLPNSVNLLSDNSTEYIAQQEITFKAGFEVKSGVGAKYFLAKIEPNLYLNLIPQYAVLTKDLGLSYASSINGILYFTYNEKYNTGIVLNYKIYNYKRELVSNLPVLNVNSLGDNFFQINLTTLLASSTIYNEEESFYMIEITNSKNEKWYLRFQYTPPN